MLPPLDTGKRQSKVSGQPIMGMADVWEETGALAAEEEDLAALL